MLDLACAFTFIALFALSVVYVRACTALKERRK